MPGSGVDATCLCAALDRHSLCSILTAKISTNPSLIGNFSYSGVHDHGPMSPTVRTPLEAAVDKVGREVNEYLSGVVEGEKEREKKRKREWKGAVGDSKG